MRVLVFAGWSAVGKQTLIRRLLQGDAALRTRFGVGGRVVAVGKNFEPLSRERCREAHTVLVQWQVREHERIRTLREWFPQADHRCYLLLRGWEQHKQALEARGVPTTVGELISNTAWIINTFFVDVMVEYEMMQEVEWSCEPQNRHCRARQVYRLPDQVGQGSPERCARNHHVHDV